jgi:uncharacterized membrane protein
VHDWRCRIGELSAYFYLKTIHVISATVLFGTGLGTAFFKWIVDKTRNVAAIRVVSEKVVLADWMFTTPAIIVQAVTGVLLTMLLGYPMTRGWVAHAIALFCFAGVCWLPVVWLQLRMRDLAQASDRGGSPLSERYWSYARIWFWLGIPAFTAVVGIFCLMIFKPG